MTRLFIAAAGLVLIQAVPLLAQTPDQEAFFESSVKPVLARCSGCHSTTAMGGLRVDSRDALLKGGASGPAIVIGDPDKSVLIAAVKHTGALKMPMGGDKLADDQIANLVAWIKNGAAWPAAKAGVKPEAVLSDHFENHIRPVLAQQCFACHSSTRSAGLSLDSLKNMLAGGKSGPAIVPGDPEKSLLMAALRHNGPIRMPKGGTRLDDQQLEDFATWIKDGAYWPAEKTAQKEYTAEQKNLWSIQPLKKPAVPAVKDTAWAINDIDRFVLAKLEKEGLKPAPSADRRTLLRRVTHDLIGLMPSHDEVKAFEKDTDPDAWEKVIDRLLASPQYGERFARHWMDVVRYGEDDYRVGGRDRAERYPFAYLYRDWLIRALNDDMSFDMFIRAQLAADQLDPQIRDQHIPALGMNGNGIWIFHASPAPIERADEWHDKVDVTTKTFLGLTVGCARCHDHKYDAIYTKDYYQLTSIFASSRFKAYPRVPKSVVDEYEKQNKVLQKKNRALRDFLENASDLYAQMLFMQSEDYLLAAFKVETEKKATVESIAEASKVDPELLARWVKFLAKKPDNYSALVKWQELVASAKGKEPEALKKLEDQAKKLAKEFVTKVGDINDKYLKLTKENEFTLAQVKGTPVSTDDDDDEKDPDKAKEPFDPLPNGLKRRLNAYQIDLKSLDREELMLWRDVFEQDVPTVDQPEPEEGARRKPGLLKLTEGALERRLTADLKAHVERARADIEAFRKSMPPQYPMVYGIEDQKQPSDLKVFVRGNPYAFGDDAPRAFPSIFSGGTPKPFATGSGRLEFAEEIIRQPITARVIANRIWRWNMGRGIVDTPSNFGMVGDKPSNPELLEYLATTFLEGGMSWKKLHKQILMSRTYQLSSASVPANQAKDADNRFFWRANRVRLEAESIQDALLQAAGALELKGIGGPSDDLTDKTVRRGVYARVSRMYPSDFQITFDVPAATISTEKRYATNVPQQRLFFLNSSFVQKQAERLAERIKDAGDPTAQVKKAFELVYQRDATPEELAAALELVTMDPMKPEAADAPKPADGKGPSVAGAAVGGTAAGDKPKEPKEDTVADDAEKSKKLADSPLRSFAWALLSANEFLFID